MPDLESDNKIGRIRKALIVEDDPDICYLLSGILKQKQLASSYVNTLSDAELALKKDIPDILILDNHLPDGLGVEFIGYMKINYPAIRIIMITAHDTAADRMNALNKGADYFIGKPFTRAAINDTLENLTC
ncbi:MAG TPA: response regulator [Panacibacter sp.]|nr:response regulator [Panacibacter sp.]